jgi:hypothetical protein
MVMFRGMVVGFLLVFVGACSVPLKSNSKKEPLPGNDMPEDEYPAEVRIVGPGVSVGSGEPLGPCSSEGASFSVDVSGALEVSHETADYGCSGTRSLEGDTTNPTVSLLLADGRALDINVFITDTELDGVDAPTTVKFWARARNAFAYSASWQSEACSTSYDVSDVDVSSESRKIYRVAGVTTCPEELTTESAEEPLSVERLDFVSDVVWFDRSLL